MNEAFKPLSADGRKLYDAIYNDIQNKYYAVNQRISLGVAYYLDRKLYYGVCAMKQDIYEEKINNVYLGDKKLRPKSFFDKKKIYFLNDLPFTEVVKKKICRELNAKVTKVYDKADIVVMPSYKYNNYNRYRKNLSTRSLVTNGDFLDYTKAIVDYNSLIANIDDTTLSKSQKEKQIESKRKEYVEYLLPYLKKNHPHIPSFSIERNYDAFYNEDQLKINITDSKNYTSFVSTSDYVYRNYSGRLRVNVSLADDEKDDDRGFDAYNTRLIGGDNAVIFPAGLLNILADTSKVLLSDVDFFMYGMNTEMTEDLLKDLDGYKRSGSDTDMNLYNMIVPSLNPFSNIELIKSKLFHKRYTYTTYEKNNLGLWHNILRYEFGFEKDYVINKLDYLPIAVNKAIKKGFIEPNVLEESNVDFRNEIDLSDLTFYNVQILKKNESKKNN